MSTPNRRSPSSPVPGPSSGYYVGHRPATIAELAAKAQENLWDPNKPLKHWLRAAEKSRRTAEAYVESGDYERGFIEFARAATIVLEKLPYHREYSTLLNPDQRQNLGMVSVRWQPSCRPWFAAGLIACRAVSVLCLSY